MEPLLQEPTDGAFDACRGAKNSLGLLGGGGLCQRRMSGQCRVGGQRLGRLDRPPGDGELLSGVVLAVPGLRHHAVELGSLGHAESVLVFFCLTEFFVDYFSSAIQLVWWIF